MRPLSHTRDAKNCCGWPPSPFLNESKNSGRIEGKPDDVIFSLVAERSDIDVEKVEERPEVLTRIISRSPPKVLSPTKDSKENRLRRKSTISRQRSFDYGSDNEEFGSDVTAPLLLKGAPSPKRPFVDKVKAVCCFM